MAKTLYEIIGVQKQATRAEIEEACKQLGEAYRPDKNAGNIIAYERFSEIERAYETLIEPDKRAIYDQELNAASEELKNAQVGSSLSSETRWKNSWIAITITWFALAAWFVVQNALKKSEGFPLIGLIVFIFVCLALAPIALELVVRLVSWSSKASVSTPKALTETWTWAFRYYFLAVAIVITQTATLLRFFYASDEVKPYPTARTELRSPSIEYSCSVNGLGQVTCTFRNTGGSSGEACVYVALNNSAGGFGAGGQTKIQGGPICSGVVQPRDVRQTVQSVTFADPIGHKYKPTDFCYDYPRLWTQVCTITTELAR